MTEITSCICCDYGFQLSTSTGTYLLFVSVQGCVTWAWHTEQKGACHLHTAGAYFHEKSGCVAGNMTTATQE